jgi:cysteine-rich repeat protein
MCVFVCIVYAYMCKCIKLDVSTIFRAHESKSFTSKPRQEKHENARKNTRVLSMRSMRGGFIFRSRGPLQKVCHAYRNIYIYIYIYIYICTRITHAEFEPVAGALETACGDGIATATETCDDGNAEDGDGCSRTCTVETGYVCTVPGRPADDILTAADVEVGPTRCLKTPPVLPLVPVVDKVAVAVA